jgi:hypothetical protein
MCALFIWGLKSMTFAGVSHIDKREHNYIGFFYSEVPNKQASSHKSNP